jgi:hypothetical protein
MKFRNLYYRPNINRMIKIKEDEVDRVCSMNGKHEKFIQILSRKKLKE